MADYLRRFMLCFLILSSAAFGQFEWVAQNSGTTETLYGVFFLSGDAGYVCGAGGTVLKTIDGSGEWQDVSPLNPPADWQGIHFFSANEGIIAGSSGAMLRTTDGGATWSPVSSGVADDLYGVSFAGDHGICGGASQTLLYSTDRGLTWQIAQTGFFGGGFRGVRMLSPEIGFAGGENSIFQPLAAGTTNGGATWTFTAFYLGNNEGRLHGIDYTDMLRGYAAAATWNGQGAIARTSDGGQTWSSQFFSTPLYAIFFPVSGASLVGYAGGEGGMILRTFDAGQSWLPENSGTAQAIHGLHFFDLENGYAVGAGGTILKRQLMVALPNEPETPPIADVLLLAECYPNPFNPAVTIRYQLREGHHVKLTIFNLQGQPLRQLRNAFHPAGQHTVQWDGRDRQGREAASGVYFYRLQLDHGPVTVGGKMILLR